MSVQNQNHGNLVAALVAALPPFASLTDRTKDALSNLGAALVLDLYETVRGAPPAQTPIPSDTEIPQNLLADRWTDIELEFLRNNFHKFSFRQLAKELGRTERAVWQKAARLKLKKGPLANAWSATETQYVMQHYATSKVSEIARKLGRSPGSVSCKMQKLGLARYDSDTPQSGAPWTKEEMQFLREHSKDDIADVASKLGRSQRAIYVKCAIEGIPREQFDAAVRERNVKIRELRRKGLTRAQIAERLGVSPSIVSSISRSVSAVNGNGASA